MVVWRPVVLESTPFSPWNSRTVQNSNVQGIEARGDSHLFSKKKPKHPNGPETTVPTLREGSLGGWEGLRGPWWKKIFSAKNPMENTSKSRKVGFVGWIVFFFVKKLAFFEGKN